MELFPGNLLYLALNSADLLIEISSIRTWPFIALYLGSNAPDVNIMHILDTGNLSSESQSLLEHRCLWV